MGMIQNNTVFNNPVVHGGYYFVQVTEVEAEPSDFVFPKLLITVRPNDIYGLPENTCFRAILHPTPRSLIHYENFFNTFFWGQRSIDDLTKAIGQWGSVELGQSEFCGITYSVVRFCYQPLRIRLQSWRIMGQEQAANGEEP